MWPSRGSLRRRSAGLSESVWPSDTGQWHGAAGATVRTAKADSVTRNHDPGCRGLGGGHDSRAAELQLGPAAVDPRRTSVNPGPELSLVTVVVSLDGYAMMSAMEERYTIIGWR